MDISYDPWNYNPNTGYHYKTCHYRFNHNHPWYHFYIVFYKDHPHYRNYFYCYYPQGNFYWCRCPSPLHSDYDPGVFSILGPNNRYPTVAQCEPYFPPFGHNP